MTTHRIRLIGPGAKGPAVSAQKLAKVLDLLLRAAKGATRLCLDGRSSARGTPPAWLDKVSDFTVTGLEAGSVAVGIEATPIESLHPGLLEQQDFFTRVDAGASSFSLMKQSLNDVLDEDADSDRYDDSLVKTFAEFGRLLDDTITGVEIDQDQPLLVDPVAVETIKRVQVRTPAPQQVMLSGRLETIRHSDRMFVLIANEGPQLKGVAESMPADHLSQHFGKTVLVHGEAQFRPSGSILRIDAHRIEAVAEHQAQLWAKLPKPLSQSVPLRDVAQPQGPRSGLSAIFGTWPGDETDEEFWAAMEQV